MRRRWIAPSAIVWLLVAAAFFLIPLIATLLFSLRSIQTGKCCSGAAYSLIVHDHQFWTTVRLSCRRSTGSISSCRACGPCSP